MPREEEVDDDGFTIVEADASTRPDHTTQRHRDPRPTFADLPQHQHPRRRAPTPTFSSRGLGEARHRQPPVPMSIANHLLALLEKEGVSCDSVRAAELGPERLMLGTGRLFVTPTDYVWVRQGRALQIARLSVIDVDTCTPMALRLATRDFGRYEFTFNHHDHQALLGVAREPAPNCFIASARRSHVALVYAVSPLAVHLPVSRMFQRPQGTGHSWHVFNPRDEFGRQGALNRFRLSNVNADFTVCESYPDVVCVPAGADDDLIRAEAAQRTKGRFPAVTYYHRASGACLARAAQPAKGLFGTVSKAYYAGSDRWDLVIALRNASPDHTLHCLDLRPRINVVGQTLAKTGGTEQHDEPNGILTAFASLQNVNAVEASYRALLTLCGDRCEEVLPKAFAAELGKTDWLELLHGLLSTAASAARHMEGGTSVLINCTDGWDRTSQIAALAQLLLDPYYRTVRGFCVLLEKDFNCFGHRFAHRAWYPDRSTKTPTQPQAPGGIMSPTSSFPESEPSPILLQFCDAVAQLLLLYPTAFEFTQELLLFLLDAWTTGFYGNFAVDSLRDFRAHDLAATTASVYAELTALAAHGPLPSRHDADGSPTTAPQAASFNDRRRHAFLNAAFQEHPGMLLPRGVPPGRIGLWYPYYLRRQDHLAAALVTPTVPVSPTGEIPHIASEADLCSLGTYSSNTSPVAQQQQGFTPPHLHAAPQFPDSAPGSPVSPESQRAASLRGFGGSVDSVTKMNVRTPALLDF